MSETKHNNHPEVIAIRTWKEYFGESLLIIFSVVLAIILTEVINKIHENSQTHEILGELRDELVTNKKAEVDQYKYHLQVLKNIDSALNNNNFQKKIFDSGRIHLYLLAPEGVLSDDLNDVAWQAAKQYNIFSKLDVKTLGLLTDIYNHQQRIIKTEDEIGKVLLSFESRKPENTKTTLILMRDNYHGWAVDRVPRLLEKYQTAIDELSKY
ncbi:MAG TPA: hypothetical protein VKR53_17780 [Puia sp.]|nr:hypothetical protein [Puia sp.]